MGFKNNWAYIHIFEHQGLKVRGGKLTNSVNTENLQNGKTKKIMI